MNNFGHAMLASWPLEPGLTYLNHGTVGVTPLRVLEAQRQIRDDIERNPSRYLLRELTEIVVGALPMGMARIPKGVFGSLPNSFGSCGSMARAVFS